MVGASVVCFHCNYGIGMLKKLIVLSLLPLSVSAKDIAIADNQFNGITVLTNSTCYYDQKLHTAFIYKDNRDMSYACWQIVGNDVNFLYTTKPTKNIPVNQFIEPPNVKRKKNLL